MSVIFMYVSGSPIFNGQGNNGLLLPCPFPPGERGVKWGCRATPGKTGLSNHSSYMAMEERLVPSTLDHIDTLTRTTLTHGDSFKVAIVFK